jgi:hypothetical protein
MLRDYMLVSPSLDGILRHDSVVYEGVKRPAEVLRVLDSPARRGGDKKVLTQDEVEVLEDYFHDIYGVFMKRLSEFVVNAESKPGEIVKLHALFQEMLKIKGMMNGKGK